MKTNNEYFIKYHFVILAVLFTLTGVAGICSVHAAIEEDSYEPDDTYEQANVIVVNNKNSEAQHHWFYKKCEKAVVEDCESVDHVDEDWVKFYALTENKDTQQPISYEIKASNLSFISDPILQVFDTDGVTDLSIPNQTDGDGNKYIAWEAPAEGIYFVRITNGYLIGDDPAWGANASYDLTVTIKGAFTLPGYVTGTVSSGGTGLGDAALYAGGGSGLSQGDGSYLLSLESGTHTVSVSKSGYQGSSFTVSVSDGGSVSKNVELAPLNNAAPSISGIKDTMVAFDRKFTLKPIASDPEGHSMSFSVSGKPAWMNFNTSTGELSGTPGEEHRGLHGPITITVKDYFGASSSLAPFTIKVVSESELGGFRHLPATYHLLF